MAESIPLFDDQDTSATLISDICHHRRDDVWLIFLHKYEPMLTRWARQMGMSDSAASEVLSDVYCKLLEHLPVFIYDPARSFRGWLHRVLQNSVIDQRRRALRKPMVYSTDLLRSEPTIESIEVESEFSEALNYLVEKSQQWAEIVKSRVSEKTWQAFTRTAIDGVEARDVANELQMSMSSVYVARNRVRKALQQLALEENE